MKRNLKALAAGVLAMAMLAVPAAASEYTTVVAPGEIVSFSKSEFYNKKTGYLIDSAVDFDNAHFEIHRKTISSGASLVDEIRINKRTEEVQIVLKSDGAIQQAPNRPNVVIKELAVRAIKSVRANTGGDYLLRKGDVYHFDGSISLRVGLESVEQTTDREGYQISLMSGDSQFIRWVSGDSTGYVDVEYGDMGIGRQRVYPNDKTLYYYDDTVPEDLLDSNPNAYIQSLNIGGGSFEYGMTLQILANQDDYIYEYVDDRLKNTSGLKWNEDDYAWTIKLSKGKHYIISDTKLRGATGTTASSNNDRDDYDDYDDEDDDRSSSISYDNSYYNPSTGGGSNVAVAISAIIAIVAVSALSIIMSTIITVKKK